MYSSHLYSQLQKSHLNLGIQLRNTYLLLETFVQHTKADCFFYISIIKDWLKKNAENV